MSTLLGQTEWAGKRLLSLLVVSGIAISGMSFFMAGDSLGIASTSNDEIATLCDNGFCYNPTTNSIPVGTFVQQSADFAPNDAPVQNTEFFGDLKLQKAIVQNYEITDSQRAVFYAAKDSFVRESVKDSNEGSNDILRVMGSGPTNNRALVAFDQGDLQTISDGRTVESATLKLFIVSNDGKWDTNTQLRIHALGSNWDEGTGVNAPYGTFVGTQNGATWNCSSTTDCVNWNGGNYIDIPTDAITVTNDVNGQWIEFDVTGDVQQFLADTENNGWIIMKSDEDASGRINFAAREASTNGPQLEVTFA